MQAFIETVVASSAHVHIFCSSALIAKHMRWHTRTHVHAAVYSHKTQRIGCLRPSLTPSDLNMRWTAVARGELQYMCAWMDVCKLGERSAVCAYSTVINPRFNRAFGLKGNISFHHLNLVFLKALTLRHWCRLHEWWQVWVPTLPLILASRDRKAHFLRQTVILSVSRCLYVKHIYIYICLPSGSERHFHLPFFVFFLYHLFGYIVFSSSIDTIFLLVCSVGCHFSMFSVLLYLPFMTQFVVF